MVWAIAGVGVVLAVLAMAFVVAQRRHIARRGPRRDAADAWLHGDPAPPAPGRDDPHAGGGPDIATHADGSGDSGGDSGGGGD